MFKSNPVTLGGPEIKPGATAPDFTAVDTSLQPVRLSAAQGKVVVLSSSSAADAVTLSPRTLR